MVETLIKNIQGTSYSIAISDQSISILPSNTEGSKAELIGCLSNIKAVLGMELRALKTLMAQTEIQAAFKRGTVNPQNRAQSFNEICLLPDEADGDPINIAIIITSNDIITGIQFSQQAIALESMANQQAKLSIQHRLTLGNDKARWTKGNAIRSIAIITGAPDEELVASQTPNSIKVINGKHKVAYTFYLDSRGYLNLLSINSLL